MDELAFAGTPTPLTTRSARQRRHEGVRVLPPCVTAPAWRSPFFGSDSSWIHGASLMLARPN